jgi:hypothetical protein
VCRRLHTPALLLLLGLVLLCSSSGRSPAPRRRRNPQPRGRPVVGGFYRVTRARRATRADFTSNRARGLRPRGPELRDPELHDGLSLYRDPRDAHATAQDFPRLGRYVQQVDVPLPSGITGRQTPGRYPSHWTLWGEPDEFLRYLVGEGIPVE